MPRKGMRLTSLVYVHDERSRVDVKVRESGLDESRVSVSSLREENDRVIPPKSRSHLDETKLGRVLLVS